MQTPPAMRWLARAQVGQGTSPTFAAGMMELDGKIALLNKEYPTAADRFDKEAGFLRQAKLYADMVRTLARAGKAYADASQPELAADRYYRAAQSAAAQNDPISAELLDIADKLVDGQLKAAMVNLRKSLPATRTLDRTRTGSLKRRPGIPGTHSAKKRSDPQRTDRLAAVLDLWIQSASLAPRVLEMCEV